MFIRRGLPRTARRSSTARPGAALPCSSSPRAPAAPNPFRSLCRAPSPLDLWLGRAGSLPRPHFVDSWEAMGTLARVISGSAPRESPRERPCGRLGAGRSQPSCSPSRWNPNKSGVPRREAALRIRWLDQPPPRLACRGCRRLHRPFTSRRRRRDPGAQSLTGRPVAPYSPEGAHGIALFEREWGDSFESASCRRSSQGAHPRGCRSEFCYRLQAKASEISRLADSNGDARRRARMTNVCIRTIPTSGSRR
jgi:hypothetical protein